MPRLFRTLPPAIFGVAIVAAHAGAVPALRHYGFPGAGPVPAAVSATIALAAMAGLYMASKRGAAAAAQTLTRTLHEARRTHDACFAACDARYARELARIEQEYQDTTRRTEHEWDQARDLAARERDAWPAILDAKEAWAAEHNERLSLAQFEAHERVYNDTLARVRSEHAAAQAALDSARDMSLARIENSRHTEWQAIASDWRERVQPVAAALEEARAAASSQFPEWSAELCESWTAPEHFASAALLGRIHVDVAAMAGGLPKDPRLALPCPPVFSLPALLTYPNQGSVLLETAKTGRDEALASLNNLMLRLLTVAPPGRLQFTVIDPVGLGQSFAGVMHLADYEESLINSRIWTQASQIEQRLGDLSEHMEKVIQMYLRNEYASIAEYNEKAGRIAEKYHFLVVADFPAQFTDVAARRLLNIAASGARCGVFTLIHWDRRQPAPPDLLPDALRKSSVWATARGRDFVLANPSLPGASPAPGSPAGARAGHGAGPSHRPGQQGFQPRRSSLRASGPHGGADLDRRHPQRADRGRRPHRRHQAPVSCPGQRHLPARPHRGQDRVGQIDAVPRPDHESGALVPAERSGVFTWSTSRKASSSNATPRTGFRTRAWWPLKATANSA